MAKLLYQEGKFKVLCHNLESLSPSKTNALIKLAGTTCYQSRETSKKTSDEFVKMLQLNKHVSATEHSNFVYEIYGMRTLEERAILGYQLFRCNKLFNITERDYLGNIYSLVISGNARVFNEAMLYQMPLELEYITSDLHDINPVLFPKVIRNGILDTAKITIIPYPDMEIGRSDFLDHTAMCVQFDEHCRGFTHEHVRHRPFSFSQASTRYVDYAKGDMDLDKFQMQFVLPYSGNLNPQECFDIKFHGATYKWNAKMVTDFMEAWYRVLRKKGLRPEEARQWLPIGLVSQIVTSGNLKEWRHWFYLRTAKGAHPEIRFTALNLLKHCQKQWPGIFDDFKTGLISEKDNMEYAEFMGDERYV